MNQDFNNLPQKRQAQLMAFDRLLTIMDELREQCPWDKKQTIDSLRHLTIEETYELSDAIMEGDMQDSAPLFSKRDPLRPFLRLLRSPTMCPSP